MEQQSLADALGLPRDDAAWVIFRDLVSGREGLRGCAGLHHEGFAVSLRAYERRVLLDWRIVHDSDGAMGELAARIGWDGTVPSVDEAVEGIRDEWRAAREPASSPDDPLSSDVASGVAEAAAGSPVAPDTKPTRRTPRRARTSPSKGDAPPKRASKPMRSPKPRRGPQPDDAPDSDQGWRGRSRFDWYSPYRPDRDLRGGSLEPEATLNTIRRCLDLHSQELPLGRGSIR